MLWDFFVSFFFMSMQLFHENDAFENLNIFFFVSKFEQLYFFVRIQLFMRPFALNTLFLNETIV